MVWPWLSSLPSAFPIPEVQAGNQPWPKNIRGFHRGDFYPVQRGRSQKGFGSVGVGWPRQQFSCHGLGLQAAALSCEPKRWQGQSQHLAVLEETRGVHPFLLYQGTETEERPVWRADGSSTHPCACTNPGSSQGKVQLSFHVQMWCILSHSLWESPYRGVSQGPGGWKKDWSLHWKADIVPSLPSCGQVLLCFKENWFWACFPESTRL